MDLSDKLRAHQIPVVARLRELLLAFRTAVDLSDTGTGKTYAAQAVAKLFGVPTLVVGPAIAESAWSRAADHFEDPTSFVSYEKLRMGHSQFGHWDNDCKPVKFFKCQTCQCKVDLEHWFPCVHHPRGIHCLETKQEKARRGRFNFHNAIRFLIFDEAHNCAGLKSMQADILIAARRQNIHTLALSATMACGPLQMRALGFLLGIHSDNLQSVSVPKFNSWLMMQGCRFEPGRGWQWRVGADKQNQCMRQLGDQIARQRGVRLRAEDIPGFPRRDIRSELYTIGSEDRQQIQSALERLEEAKAQYKDPDLAISKCVHQLQEVELLKVPLYQRLGEKYRAEGFSVVFFVNYRHTLEELQKRFPQAEVIDGESKDRPGVVDRFQRNETRELLVNNKAGSAVLSLQDLDGEHPRIGIVSTCPNAVTMRQLFGRLCRDGGKSIARYLIPLADKTPEVTLHRRLEQKLKNLDCLNDHEWV